MANLTHAHQLTSIFFTEDFAAYLLAAGYKGNFFMINERKTITFVTADKAVMVTDDAINFYDFHPGEEDQTNDKYTEYNSIKSVSQLNTVQFMMLMHIMDIVPLQQCKQLAEVEATILQTSNY